ncbi:hypothetical protein ABZ896_17260 [Streptomyces sp. NPDC047072]|uniref:hypothetical protein n=1 Tax=Streptomyces sp. NPDC047072 TaxID=3154809 RepID=UPI0033F8BDA4
MSDLIPWVPRLGTLQSRPDRETRRQLRVIDQQKVLSQAYMDAVDDVHSTARQKVGEAADEVEMRTTGEFKARLQAEMVLDFRASLQRHLNAAWGS